MKFDRRTAIEVRQMRFFAAVAETGTISAAANLLGVAQPSLSEAISKLEDQLDIRLIDRSSKGVSLTEAGEAFNAYATRFLDEMDLAWQDVRAIGGSMSGEVTIALPPSLALLLSVPLAETIRLEYPNIKLRIVEAMSGTVRQWVLDEELQIGAIYQGQDCSHVASVKILTEDLFLVSAPDNWPEMPDNAGMVRKPFDFKRLPELPLVLPSRTHGLRALLEANAAQQNVTLNVEMEIDSLRHITTIVERASAYSVLSHSAVFELVSQGRLCMIPLQNPSVSRNAYLVYKRGRSLTAATRIVQETLISILGELVARHEIHASFAVPEAAAV